MASSYQLKHSHLGHYCHLMSLRNVTVTFIHKSAWMHASDISNWCNRRCLGRAVVDTLTTMLLPVASEMTLIHRRSRQAWSGAKAAPATATTLRRWNATGAGSTGNWRFATRPDGRAAIFESLGGIIHPGTVPNRHGYQSPVALKRNDEKPPCLINLLPVRLTNVCRPLIVRGDVFNFTPGFLT
jgi:hypothetical protein